MAERLNGKEIAKLLGVSPTTISLVVNGKAGVSPQKRKQIIEFMLNNGYSEDEIGTVIKKNVVLLFRDDLFDIKQIFYNDVITNILRFSKDLPYNIMVKSINYENNVDDGELLSVDCEWDAAILCSDPNEAVLCCLYQSNIPFVVLDSSVESSLACSVSVDYEDAAYRLTEYLVNNGHKKIALISNSRGDQIHRFTLQSYNGFQNAMLEHNIPIEHQFVRLNASSEDALYEFLDSICLSDNRPTAIFCSTDSNAIPTMRYLHEKGIRVPEDISVVGMDDISLSAYTTPTLTTMRVDRNEMTKKCLEILSDLLSGKKPRSAKLSPCRLIERDSVAKLSK